MSTLPFSQIREEKVEWLVPSMLPLGCVSLLVGRGGQGKSTFCGHLAAKLSRGEPAFPGDRPTEPANTLFISAEDSLSHVLVPRIRVAGGDLTRIHGWDLDARGLTLPDDVDDLEDAILRIGARLVVIDPLSAFLNSRIDSHKDAGVRAALRPLHVLAERNQVALLGVMHLNKSAGGSVDVRISGSTAWSNAGRASLVFGLPLMSRSDRRDGS